MNIYSKMQEVRCRLQELNLKKSGLNKFAGFSYYELGDFLPVINYLLKEYNLFSQIMFDENVATLKIINCEKVEEEIIFTSPVAGLTLKGAHDIQNLGGVQTYLRRYLYMTAFEIVEHDELDAILNPPAELISEQQQKLLYVKGRGKDVMAINEVLNKYGFKDSKSITKDRFSAILGEISKL